MNIFFDLDDTIWDFSRNTTETLGEMYFHFDFEKNFNFTKIDFQNNFPITNDRLWEQLSQKLLDADTLRNIRFQKLFEDMGHEISLEFSKKLSDYYMEKSPFKHHLVEGARELLENLKKNGHKLHIITNGFENIQHQKLKSSQITHFFTHIITSEQTQVKKPDTKMYEYACALVNELPQNCIMIGDHWGNDVEGAINAGMNALFFNPNKKNIPIEKNKVEKMKNIPQIYFLSEILDFI